MTTASLDRTIAERPASYLLTRANAHLRLRPVVASDGPLLAAFVARLVPADRRFRFLDRATASCADDVAAMLAVDHRRSEHVLAFDTATGELVASLMLAADPAMDTAEAAIAVASPWKGRGIGWALLRHAADLALVRGVRRLRCIENRADHEPLEVERTLGFSASAVAGKPDLILLEAALA